ncbi:MAG: 23S rRNA (uracil(1939)-C(5))-methyltransferase RlmD [Chitinophagaceae bacterium]|nr:23S rRNA (uracil(1939)-C(5))-methyltransferase RlmD [Chitinophagaceae bacterium]OQY92524.1 MAG: 23S rRNA (uracil(1939)-C(5))-methyltransferase RlmD [Sphingobacteriales bacterium UTBCD1]
MRRKNRNIVLEKIVVEDYAAEGRCLAKVNGKVIFIERVVPGDVVDVKIFKSKKDWAEGWPLRFHSLSKDRVQPFCSHFGICGGCQWQMLPYEKQLEYKQKQVMDNLQRIGKIPLPQSMPITGADETRYYRNKLEYTFGNRRFLLPDEVNDPDISSEENVAGFHAPGIFDKVVHIDKCYLQAEPSNLIRTVVCNFAKANGFEFYDIRGHHGFIRTMQVRICTTGEVMVNIVFGRKDEEKQKKLMDHLLQQVPSVTTLLYTINPKMNDSLNDLEPVTYYGKGYVTEKLESFYFRIGPKSFFQTNTHQAEKLYGVVRDFAELTGNETLYDLYCGTGSIGIFLSPGVKKIVGVDIIGAAIEDAKQNAQLNDLHNTEFYAGDVTAVCNDEFFKLHGSPDVVITDPPRAGMHEKLVKKILDIAAPVVVYVSCNPATQGRDLNLLGEKYEVTGIRPLDMFPHTQHIENVVQLKLKNL